MNLSSLTDVDRLRVRTGTETEKEWGIGTRSEDVGRGEDDIVFVVFTSSFSLPHRRYYVGARGDGRSGPPLAGNDDDDDDGLGSGERSVRFDARFQYARLLREQVFGQERDFAFLDAEHTLLEVYAGLVGLEHVESEKEVDVPSLIMLHRLMSVTRTRGNLRTHLHDGDRTWQVEVRQFELCAVHSSEDLGSPNAPGYPSESFVYKAHDPLHRMMSPTASGQVCNHAHNHKLQRIPDSLKTKWRGQDRQMIMDSFDRLTDRALCTTVHESLHGM
jgi:hypothetical protein